MGGVGPETQGHTLSGTSPPQARFVMNRVAVLGIAQSDRPPLVSVPDPSATVNSPGSPRSCLSGATAACGQTAGQYKSVARQSDVQVEDSEKDHPVEAVPIAHDAEQWLSLATNAERRTTCRPPCYTSWTQ